MSVRIAVQKLAGAGLSVLLVACGSTQESIGPLEGIAAKKATLASLGGTLVCAPQPHSIASQSIGPSGGRLKFGKHKLDIPQGALSATVVITAEALSEDGNPVRFTPEGLKFAVPAQLELKYDNCSDNPLPKVIVYTDALGNILERLGSSDDNRNKKVQADLQHFSKYAVAW